VTGLARHELRRREVISFEVDESMGRVSILGVFRGGRDDESVLGSDADSEDPTDPVR
jgi:hypothetical protein